VDGNLTISYGAKNYERGIIGMKLTKEIVIEKCNSFVDFQIWPLTQQLDVSGWLSNFREDEIDYAVTLLNSFTYYSENIVNKMLQAAFDNLLYSVHVRTRKFRNPAKTKRYVVPASRANSKTQGGTRSDSDSICHRHHAVFSGFQTV
jgi:hypothetical protein